MFCSGDIENIVLRFVEEKENNNSAVRSKQNHEREKKRGSTAELDQANPIITASR